jgi:hypothetical protein
MKKPIILISFILLSLACLGGGAVTLKAPEGSGSQNIRLYSGGKDLRIDENDQNALIEELFGRNYLFYESSTQISHIDKPAKEIHAEIDENLLNENFRLRTDWTGMRNFRLSEWQRGDLQLLIVTFDNLSSEEIRELNLVYGLQGLNPAETLIIAHLIDTSQELPDQTSTAEIESRFATRTAQAVSESNAATEDAFSFQATRTADAFAVSSTQQALEDEAAELTMIVQQTQSVEATQTAVSAAQTAAVTPTPTIDPDPELALPFEDNFDQGLRPEWRVLGSTEPVFIDGRVTAPTGEEVTLQIGNSSLQNYTIEFDLIASTKGSDSGIRLYFTPIRYLRITSRRLVWWEFKENSWQETSRHDTNIRWRYSPSIQRLTIIRNGDSYEILKDGTLELSLKYGDPSGSNLVIVIIQEYTALDNLVIKGN